MTDSTDEMEEPSQAQIFRLDNVRLAPSRLSATPYHLTIFLWPDRLQWRVRYQNVDHKLRPEDIRQVRAHWTHGSIELLGMWLLMVLAWYGDPRQTWAIFWIITIGAVLVQLINWRRLRLDIETTTGRLQYKEPWRVWGRRGSQPAEVVEALREWCVHHGIPWTQG